MIKPLLDFRSRLVSHKREALDASRFLTSAIRGFVLTIPIPLSSAPLRSTAKSGPPSTLTLISRLSCRRAGTRFNSRGIDDDGNVSWYADKSYSSQATTQRAHIELLKTRMRWFLADADWFYVGR